MPKKPSTKDGWLKLQHARGFVLQKYPYFYKTLIALIPEEAPGEGTLFVTDSMVLGIDMEWFSTLEVDVAGGCLIHEVMHILRGMDRIREFADPKRAGYAFDIPINDDLKRSGIKLPPWVVYSSTHNLPTGLTGEKYYELLKAVELPPGRVGAGRCGSCNGEHDRPTKHPGRTPKEVRHFRRQGLEELARHAAKSGYNPCVSITELLDMEDAGPAIIPWQSMVRSTLGRTFELIKRGHSDYSLVHPSRRSYATGFLRPGLIDSGPSVVVIEDSSGSMGQAQLKPNRVELVNIMQQLGLQTLWFISADVVSRTKPKLVTPQELRSMPVVGRGSTDFRGPIADALRVRPRPNLIIYSTDGGGTAPEHKPQGVEFIWLLAPGGWTRSPCNWGKQILTTNDPEERKRYQILS